MCVAGRAHQSCSLAGVSGPIDRSTQRRPLVRRSVRDSGSTSIRQNDLSSASMTWTIAARMTAEC